MKNTTTEQTLGFAAMIITCIYTGISMPNQIIQVWEMGNADSLSLFMLVMLLATFTSWAIYALKKVRTDWYIFVPNSIGAVGALILVILKVKLS